MSDALFEHQNTFAPGEVSGNVRLGRFEAQYEELFSQAFEDGVITTEERAQLDRAASALGLDRDRVLAVERALSSAWQARHGALVKPRPETPADMPVASLRPLELESHPHVQSLLRRIDALEGRIKTLQEELDEARSHIAVDIDFSDLNAPAAQKGDPDDLYRGVRHDPRDVENLRALLHAVEATEADRAVRIARVIAFLGQATAEERALVDRHASAGLIRPNASLTPDAWKRNLFHPDEELLTGEIFSIITSPVLLGKVTTLRHQNLLPKLDPQKLADPKTSTVQAVRCFGWVASILGMNAPPLYTDPSYDGVAEMVPGVPPTSRLGKAALSGRSPTELAFLGARHLAAYREDHFIRLLFPAIQDLEDIFLAALVIGQPQLPLAAGVKQRALPIAKAIEPLLEAAQIDRLRGHFMRFVEEGGRTNLQRWAAASDFTTARAGLLLADDLTAAKRMLEIERVHDLEGHVDDLIVFYTGDRCSRLRAQLGITVP